MFMHTSTRVFKNVILNKTANTTSLLRFNSKSVLTFMVFALFFMFSNPIQAQCEDGSACAANYDPGVGNGFQTFKAKLYCSNSGAVENGLINCTTAADTDGCGIDASQEQSMVALYDGTSIYRGAETYNDLFSESPIPLNQYLQWIVFATPPTIKGTKIQAVGASDSWFLFHAGAFTTDMSKATADIPYYSTVMDALTDPANNTAFGSGDLIETSNVNQFKSWTNDNAIISDDVFNIYYIGLSYNRPTNGSLNFKVKECEIGCEPDLQCNLTNQDLICEDDFPSALNNINDIFNVIEDCGGPISLNVSDSDITFDDSDPSNPTRTIVRTYEARINGLVVGECNQTITITDSVIEVTGQDTTVCEGTEVDLTTLTNPDGGTFSEAIVSGGLNENNFDTTSLSGSFEIIYTFTDENGCTNNCLLYTSPSPRD